MSSCSPRPAAGQPAAGRIQPAAAGATRRSNARGQVDQRMLPVVAPLDGGHLNWMCTRMTHYMYTYTLSANWHAMAFAHASEC
jgi:hypothetical protein